MSKISTKAPEAVNSDMKSVKSHNSNPENCNDKNILKCNCFYVLRIHQEIEIIIEIRPLMIKEFNFEKFSFSSNHVL